MSAMVSVIIPNYNEAKFISKCLDSVLNQTYKDIEIIIIDDGSDDGSIDIIKYYVEKNENIQAFYNHRQNAAIARNLGIKNAKGKYLFFLDADDYVYPESIEKMVKAAEENDVDFVLGNMKEMDEEDNVTKELNLFTESKIAGDYRQFLGLIPAPSNKLYFSRVIKENELCFGNVRIGQDLNFFLKYLCCCNKVYTLNNYIYAWRDVRTSMSRGVNFKIFDIVESFKDVKLFYQTKDMSSDYDKYVRMIEYHNYYRQMDKQMNFSTRKTRKLVVDYFTYHISSLGDVSNCSNYNQFSSAVKKCRMKMRLKFIYISKLYKSFYMKKNHI